MSNNVLFAKSFNAGGALAANSSAKSGSNDYDVLQAAGSAATEKILGITTEVAASSAERVDVVLAGVADLKLNGTVSRGDPITADSSGLGITAAPSAGTNARIVGFAMVTGVAGDIIPCLLAQGMVQG